MLATNVLHAWGSQLLIKYSFLERLKMMIKRHLFWTVLIGRIIPIFPAVVINVYAGVFKLRFSVFILATFLGKIPAMLVFSYVGDGIWSSNEKWLQAILIYSAFLLLLFIIYRNRGLLSNRK
ncbi:TVP38/TMEM64 family protein [Paenibacillus massiliensis]|uniref:TVP38/TMEM64 family protein n=1 Tax=Paenibacillus massiliensis TaxID=225917 RepID=UPI0038996C24